MREDRNREKTEVQAQRAAAAADEQVGDEGMWIIWGEAACEAEVEQVRDMLMERSIHHLEPGESVGRSAGAVLEEGERPRGWGWEGAGELGGWQDGAGYGTGKRSFAVYTRDTMYLVGAVTLGSMTGVNVAGGDPHRVGWRVDAYVRRDAGPQEVAAFMARREHTLPSWEVDNGKLCAWLLAELRASEARCGSIGEEWGQVEREIAALDRIKAANAVVVEAAAAGEGAEWVDSRSEEQQRADAEEALDLLGRITGIVNGEEQGSLGRARGQIVMMGDDVREALMQAQGGAGSEAAEAPAPAPVRTNTTHKTRRWRG